VFHPIFYWFIAGGFTFCVGVLFFCAAYHAKDVVTKTALIIIAMLMCIASLALNVEGWLRGVSA